MNIYTAKFSDTPTGLQNQENMGVNNGCVVQTLGLLSIIVAGVLQ